MINTPFLEKMKIKNNIDLAKKRNLNCGYFYQTENYGTMSGNRFSISTIIYHGIKYHNRIMNKTFVTKIESDLIRNYKETKSNEKTHNNKIEKLKIKYPELKEMEKID